MLRPYIGLLIHLLIGLGRPGANQGWDNAPTPAPQGGGGPSGLALVAAGLSIASWFLIPLVGAVAGMFLGRVELGKIEKGESSPDGKVFAQIGWWAGLANLLLTVVGGCLFFAIWVGVFGLAIGGGMLQEGMQQ